MKRRNDANIGTSHLSSQKARIPNRAQHADRAGKYEEQQTPLPKTTQADHESTSTSAGPPHTRLLATTRKKGCRGPTASQPFWGSPSAAKPLRRAQNSTTPRRMARSKRPLPGIRGGPPAATRFKAAAINRRTTSMAVIAARTTTSQTQDCTPGGACTNQTCARVTPAPS